MGKKLLVAAIVLFAITITIVIWLPQVLNKDCNIEAMRAEPKKDLRIKVLALCTPNYVDVGGPGVEALRDYCNKNDYEFKLYDKKLVDDLHINFSKMKMLSDELEKDDADYTVVSDTDIEIKDDNIKIENIIEKYMQGKEVIGMPQDVIFCTRVGKNTWLELRNNVMTGDPYNAGFIIAKNGKEAKAVMDAWIDAAKNECKEEGKGSQPNQTVLRKCVLDEHGDKIKVLPYQLHGVGCSAGIRQKIGVNGNVFRNILEYFKKRKTEDGTSKPT